MINLSVYKGKKVLVTGHTGFKGSWLCKILNELGAKVFGYSLDPPTQPSLYDLANISDIVTTKKGDVADYYSLYDFYKEIHPDYVFHLAAQPLVRESYIHPRETYNSNVMGTVNILECVRLLGAQSFLNVTTDKVYYNLENDRRYEEGDLLNGYDPYSNSKSCSEYVTSTYRRSFPEIECAISTARAGNVIGGGDFAKDRIIPDCIRASISGETIIVRNPLSIRPYQHVFEPLFAYLSIGVAQSLDKTLEGSYNVGPSDKDCWTTGNLVTAFCDCWGEKANWKYVEQNGPHEANFLKLNSSKIESVLGFVPTWGVEKAIRKTIEFTKNWINDGDVKGCMSNQIWEYISESKSVRVFK